MDAFLKETAMKLKCGDPEVMVAPSVPSPPMELQGSGDGNEVEEIESDDDSEVQASGDSDENDDGGLNCGSLENTSLPFVVQLRNLNEVFCKSPVSHAGGDSGIKLIDKLCRILRRVIQRASDDAIAAAAVSPETSITCVYLLRVLSSPGQLSLKSVSRLLRSLCQLIGVIAGRHTWLAEGCLKHIDLDVDCRTKFTGSQFGSMCSELLKYLTDLVPDLVVDNDYDLSRVNQEAFSDAVDDLHKFACWGLSYYGSCPALADVRDSLGKLLENEWEWVIDAGYGELACKRIGAAINAQSANSGTRTLQWLEEKEIVGKLLYTVYRIEDVPEVTQFLTILGKHGVVVRESCILKGLMICSEDQDREDINAAYEICAHMLEVLDISTYSDKFLESVLGWLETRQANSVIGGLRRFSILKKLHKIDKQRRWEERVCTLFRKCATSVSSCDLVECLKEVADHYSIKPYHVGGSSKDSFLHKDEELQAKLLQDCSGADVVTCISTEMASGSLNHSKLYIQKAETWKAKEVDLDDHMNSSSKLTEALSTAFPNSRRETAKRCLDRMVVAQHLSVGLNPNKSNTFTSEIATAMSPELQALEALKNESLLHCKVVQQVDELSEKHVRDYDALREKQYQELVKFVEACRKEKEDVVWDALYEKVKALAVVERTGVGEDKDMSSEDILKRLFLNTVGACKQVEAKLSQVEKEHRGSLDKLSQVVKEHRGSLDRLPNVECAVCCAEFSAKRKRACLDPCGHASACVDCAPQVWKRTKKCFVCNTSIGQPVAVPSKLFF